MSDFRDVCALDDIPRLGARRVRRADGVDIAVFRTADDRVFALLDRCPHKGGPLSQGIVFGDRVACPLHNWTIELSSGQAVAPDEGCTNRFAVEGRGRAGAAGSEGAGSGDEAAGVPRLGDSDMTEAASPCPPSAAEGRGAGEGGTVHLLLLRRGLRRDHRIARRRDHRRARRSGPSGQLRQAVFEGRDAASHRASGAARGARAASRTAPRSHAPRERATWDEALDHVADRFAAIIREHGPDAVAFYVSGQLLTEDYHVFNKVARGVVGTNNIDTNSRLCMSSAVAGYKATLGADAPPCSYEDLDHADLVLIAGSNTAFAHPVLYRRLEAARARGGVRVIVVDPRRTVTAREGDLHLAIAPGTDVALFHGILHLLLWEERIDRAFIDAHTEGFDALKSLVREYTPAMVAHTCGIAERDLVTAARWFGESRAALSLYCQGLNQSTSGTAKNAALVNLHLATGQIGRPGAGPFSLTGQPNAMGGREVGGLANLLPGHREAADAAHRDEIARLWGIDALPASRGMTAVEMFDALRTGDIRAVWIACTNPAQSLPDASAVHEALSRAELVVLQEAYVGTETARYADVLLPAATWGEKEGTVTNSERRISRVRAAIAPPGEARADWAIAADFGRRLAARLRPAQRDLFAFADAEGAWNEHREATRGRDLDITGLSYALLEARGPQQWPFRAGDATGAVRLYADGAFPTANGRARFAAMPYKPTAERVDARHPIRLTTGRLRDQWHAMSRTGTVAQLFSHAPEPCIEMHADDLARRGLRAGDLVKVESRRGAIVLPVQPSRRGRERPGVHRDALGRALSRRQFRRQHAHRARVRSAVQAARTQARGGTRIQGRTAVASGCVRLSRLGRCDASR